MKNNLPPANPTQIWTVPPLFIFTNSDSDKKIKQVTAKASVGDLTIQVNTTEGLEVSDWIMLKLLNSDKDLIASELKNNKVEPDWTEIIEKGISVKVGSDCLHGLTETFKLTL